MYNCAYVATVLTACGIETDLFCYKSYYYYIVATVLTACGIETELVKIVMCMLKKNKLQQYLPLAVLKLKYYTFLPTKLAWLQQYLPLAVLKHMHGDRFFVAEDRLQQYLPLAVLKLDTYHQSRLMYMGCNSTYRLRY